LRRKREYGLAEERPQRCEFALPDNSGGESSISANEGRSGPLPRSDPTVDPVAPTHRGGRVGARASRPRTRTLGTARRCTQTERERVAFLALRRSRQSDADCTATGRDCTPWRDVGHDLVWGILALCFKVRARRDKPATPACDSKRSALSRGTCRTEANRPGRAYKALVPSPWSHKAPSDIAVSGICERQDAPRRAATACC
jgi:hypothetical protein